VINEKSILEQISNPFIINMKSSFQDREYLYMTMEYLRGGDLRYHLCFYEFFNEEQTSTSHHTQSSSPGASSWDWSTSTPKASSTATSSRKTWSFRRTGTCASLISEWPARRRKATPKKPVAPRAIWPLKSFAG
jgi:hypothetical protein